MEIQNMFPGYVFLESKNEKKLTEELKEYKDIVRILGEDINPIAGVMSKRTSSVIIKRLYSKWAYLYYRRAFKWKRKAN